MISTRHLIIITLASTLGLAQLQAGNYSIDFSKSEIGTEVHASPPHNFTCKTQSFDCDIELDPNTLDVLRADCDFKFSALDSGNNKRDKKMRNWMEIEKFPAGHFTMQQVTAADEAGHYIATGLFRMHGKSLPLQIPFTITREGEKIILEGHTELNDMNWGLDKIRILFFSVDPMIRPYFRLEGSIQSDV